MFEPTCYTICHVLDSYDTLTERQQSRVPCGDANAQAKITALLEQARAEGLQYPRIVAIYLTK